MAKKKQETKVEEPVVEETVVMEEPVVETPKIKKEVKPEPKKNKWEVKDRLYYLKGNKKPLSYSIRTSNLFWFDEEAGYEREIKYCQNQRTCFVDEMKGDQRLEHVVFRSGSLFVPREQTTLQKFLSLYHPHKDKLFYEHNPVAIAEDDLDFLEMEVEALSIAKDLDVDAAEAILRVELGSDVSKMSSKELRRDLLVFARRNPVLFLELVNDDNVQLRNFGIKAVEEKIIRISPDQRHFLWGSTGKKIMTVPFDEHPYSALAQWFKTDEGMEIYSNIEKRLK
tara:strand:- start:35390 stop:36235 length:846 start_codon:yes stop_codon:yes gene_type:complete